MFLKIATNRIFASITKTSYEVLFYSFINGEAKQCYTLAEEGKLDENKLAEVFDSMVNIIRSSKLFKEDKINIATIRFDKSQIKMDMEYYISLTVLGMKENLKTVK